MYYNTFDDQSSNFGIVFDLSRSIRKKTESMKSINSNLYWNYLMPKTQGTATPYTIDSDFVNKSISQTIDDYFDMMKFEKKYNKSSNQMYVEWNDGKVHDIELTEWLSTYLRVWDKVNLGNAESPQSTN